MSLPRMRRGEVLTADKINAIIDAVNAARVSVAPGLFELRRTPGGTFIDAPWLAAADVCVASVTTEISKATDATHPGHGTLQRYTSVDTTASPWALGALTGTDEDCASINQDKRVALGSTVVAVKSLGVWWVVEVGSCSNLLS